jgi:hypothetical protein
MKDVKNIYKNKTYLFALLLLAGTNVWAMDDDANTLNSDKLTTESGPTVESEEIAEQKQAPKVAQRPTDTSGNLVTYTTPKENFQPAEPKILTESAVSDDDTQADAQSLTSESNISIDEQLGEPTEYDPDMNKYDNNEAKDWNEEEDGDGTLDDVKKDKDGFTASDKANIKRMDLEYGEATDDEIEKFVKNSNIRDSAKNSAIKYLKNDRDNVKDANDSWDANDPANYEGKGYQEPNYTDAELRSMAARVFEQASDERNAQKMFTSNPNYKVTVNSEETTDPQATPLSDQVTQPSGKKPEKKSSWFGRRSNSKPVDEARQRWLKMQETVKNARIHQSGA